jgi:hypothetical protein
LNDYGLGWPKKSFPIDDEFYVKNIQAKNIIHPGSPFRAQRANFILTLFLCRKCFTQQGNRSSPGLAELRAFLLHRRRYLMARNAFALVQLVKAGLDFFPRLGQMKVTEAILVVQETLGRWATGDKRQF